MSWKIAPIGRGGDLLYSQAGTPSLDLRFAEKKALTDYVSGDNLVTFTRASSGTYVDGDGLIKTTPVNLLTYSEEFDNNSWAKFNSTVNANTASAPSGETTAGALIENTATSSHSITKSISASSGTTYTFTVHAKANERSHIDLSISGVVTIGCIVRFTLSGSGTSTFRQGSPTPTHSITALSGGWYRCQLTFTTTSAGSAQAGILVAPDASSSAFYTGDGVSGVYLWGAQLEEGSTATDYIPTTSSPGGAPRFDHDPTTGESLGLLVEEARTNLVTDSSLTTIGTPEGAAISPTTETNPEGIDLCQRLLSDAGTEFNGHRIRVAASSANNITVSAFVKKDTHRYVYIGFGGAVNSFTALFDIDPTVTGDRLLGQGGNGAYTNIDAGYQNFPNGWVRIWAVGTTSGVDGTTVGFSPDASTFNITNWNAAGTEAIFIHGVQYENDVTFPTSYIPTEGSTVTRAADVAEITGANFSSWFNTSEKQGTVFIEVATKGASGIDAAFAIGSNNDADRWLQQYFQFSSVFYEYEQGSPPAHPYTVGTFIKSAIGRSQGDNAVGLSGSIVQTDSSSGAYTPVFLKIGISGDANRGLNGHIKRLSYFPVRLPNETLQTITT